MFISTNPTADAKLTEEIQGIQTMIAELRTQHTNASRGDKMKITFRIHDLEDQIKDLRTQYAPTVLDEAAAVKFISEKVTVIADVTAVRESFAKRVAEDPRYAISGAEKVIKAEAAAEVARKFTYRLVKAEVTTLTELIALMKEFDSYILSDYILSGGSLFNSTSVLHNSVNAISFEGIKEFYTHTWKHAIAMAEHYNEQPKA